MRRAVSSLPLLVAFLGGTLDAVAQEAPPEISLPGTEVHEFRSASGTLFDLYVALPQGYVADGSTDYPVLYSLDAGTAFAGLVQMYRLMSMGDDELAPLPPMILVGIDRARASGVQTGITRFFDMTPTADVGFSEGLSSYFGTAVPTGGASEFLRVLKDEVIPWVESSYSAGSARGIAGHSLGGLFATYALFTSPDTFSHYLLGSPSFWWDDGVILDLEEAYFAEHDDLEAEVFVSVGSLEEAMVPDMLSFTETLEARAYRGLRLETQVLDGESHLSSAFLSVSRGLGSLFRPR